MSLSADEVGNQRQHLHRNDDRYPRLNPKDPGREHRVGAKGEKAWEIFTGYPMDYSAKPRGDIIDFRMHLHFGIDDIRLYSFDIKTAEPIWNNIPDSLLVKVEDIEKPVDVYMLAHLYGVDYVDFLGWQWRSIVRTYEIVERSKEIGPCHCVPLQNLMPMEELVAKMPYVQGKSWTGIYVGTLKDDFRPWNCKRIDDSGKVA